MRTMSAIRDDDQPNLMSERKQLITKPDADNDSEGANNAATSHKRPVSFASKYLLYPDSPVEATGCAIDAYARASIYMSSFFVGPALLKLASQQAIDIAGCLAKDEGYDECAKASRIYGFKPSSLLTNMGTIAFLVSAISLPLFGAVVDFTPYRRQIGMFTAFGLAFIKIFELGLGPTTWFFVVCLQIMSSFLYSTHSATMYTYSAELSNQPTIQSKFQSSFALIIFVSMFLYTLEVLIPSRILHFEDVGIARFAILVSIINSVPLLSVGWIYFFRDRPPASKLPKGQTILTAGFRKLASTYKEISSEFRSVKHFLVFSLAWSEAGFAALPTIATTYMSEFLDMNSLQIGAVLLVTMIGGMPGSLIGNYFCRLYQNPVRSVQICLATFTLNTLGAGIFLRANTQHLMYGFAFVWGICQGWMHPQHTTIFVTISPKENGAVEMMGLFLFFCKILSFVPPLIFTILNEVGIPMWIGISSLAMYSFVGFLGLIYMEDYDSMRAYTTSKYVSKTLSRMESTHS